MKFKNGRIMFIFKRKINKIRFFSWFLLPLNNSKYLYLHYSLKTKARVFDGNCQLD